MIYFFIGKPCSGKGTQSQKLAETKSFHRLSVGDSMRKLNFIQTNNDSIPTYEDDAIDLVKTFLLKHSDKSIIIDGFPRTEKQSEWIINNINLYKVFHIRINDNSELLSRVISRKVCLQCDAIYSSKTLNIDCCIRCKGKLNVRLGDSVENLNNRINFFEENIDQITNILNKKLILIDGNYSKEIIFREITDHVENYQ